MRRIHQIISRAAVVAAAGLVALSLSARTASATTLYQTNFSTYSGILGGGSMHNGNIDTQGGFGVVPAANTSVTVQTGGPDASFSHTAGQSVAAAPTLNFSSTGSYEVDSFVTVTLPGTYSSSNSPAFGLVVDGNNSGSELGSLMVVAGNGDIVDSNGNDAVPANDFTLSTGTVAAGGSINLEIQTLFSGSSVTTVNYLVGTGTPITGVYNQIDTYNPVGVGGFSYAGLYGNFGYEAGTDVDASAVFTNYAVTTDAAIPEPTGLAAIAVGGALLVLRRKRAAVSAI